MDFHPTTRRPLMPGSTAHIDAITKHARRLGDHEEWLRRQRAIEDTDPTLLHAGPPQAGSRPIPQPSWAPPASFDVAWGRIALVLAGLASAFLFGGLYDVITATFSPVGSFVIAGAIGLAAILAAACRVRAARRLRGRPAP
jgi:hypothetical protein